MSCCACLVAEQDACGAGTDGDWREHKESPDGLLMLVPSSMVKGPALLVSVSVYNVDFL